MIFREAVNRLRALAKEPEDLEAVLLLEKLVEAYRTAYIVAGRA